MATGVRVSAVLCGAVLLWMVASQRGDDACQPRTTTFPGRFGSVSGIAYDGRSLWITLDGKPLIYQVDPGTGAITRQFPFVTGDTGGNAWDGSVLWQLAYLERMVYRIDVRTGAATPAFRSPGRGLCAGMTFDGRHLWIANFDDAKVYQVDQHDGGRVVRTIDGNFETTGLAWDGRHLWTGILVGTKTHDEVTPYTGFVQERDLAASITRRVLPVSGVGPGASDWVPGGGVATRFWWYDGYHARIVVIELSPHVDPRVVTGGVLLLLAAFLPTRSAGAQRNGLPS